MRWFGRFAKKAAPMPERRDIALFPLQTVLFPGGALALKVFEARYLDMLAACMKEEEVFGICLVARGAGSGAGRNPAHPHPVGTLARITAWDGGGDSGRQGGESGDDSGAESAPPRLLYLNVAGGERFRILESRAGENGLLRAEVELLAEVDTPVPPPQQRLLPLLREIVARGDAGGTPVPEPRRWESAAWVGYRLCEIVPVQALAKQKLLELDDPVSRLEILDRYLEQHGLVR